MATERLFPATSSAGQQLDEFCASHHVVVQPQLTCGHCVACNCLEPVSPMERATVRMEWERQELACMEGLRVSRERYGVEESGRAIFSNDETSCRRKLARILPLIVLRNDGTLVQYDPPPHSRDEQNAAASPGSDSDSQDSAAAKVTLNGLYRDAGDSVCFSPNINTSNKESSRRLGHRWRKRQASKDKDTGADDDNLVGVLGLMKIAPSGLRRRRGAGTLASLLLPLKMTNVSITAKVEEPPTDLLMTEGRYALQNSQRNSEDLLGDEFKDSSSSSSKWTRSGRGLKHSRSWSWDSCFSGGSSFRDLSIAGLPSPPKGTPTLATSSSASSLAGSLVSNVCSYVNNSSAGIRERIKKSLGSKIYAPMMNAGVSVNTAIIRAT